MGASAIQTSMPYLMGKPGLLRVFDLSGKPLDTILFEVLTDGDVTLVPSSSRIKVYNKRQNKPNITFKHGCRRPFPLIGASKLTRDHTYEYLGKQLTFFEEDSDNLLFRKPYISKKLFANSRKMKICMGFGIRCRDHALWPRYIDLFTKKMPSLVHLELHCLISPNTQALPRKLSGEGLGSVELLDQERRYKLRLLSFITLRSPGLKRIILPAGSGTERDADGMIIHTLIVEKPCISTPGDCAFLWEEKVLGSDSHGQPLIYRDEVLDASLIRRHQWSELCHVPNSRFVIKIPDGQSKDTILTSEVLHDDRKHWKLVDERAYRLPGTIARKGWKTHEVDEMVHLCASLK